MANYMKAAMAVASMSMLKMTPMRRKLVHIISLSRNSQYADSRDKVYSLLGLASDTEAAPAPNYLKPVEEVYCEYLGINHHDLKCRFHRLRCPSNFHQRSLQREVRH